MPAYRPQAGDEGADMAISAKELPLGKVFTPDFRFTIPSFQRAYIWKTENILQLVSDLDDACKSPGTPYFLGSLILVREGDNRYDVIDGQQRLVSLSIIIAVELVKLFVFGVCFINKVPFVRGMRPRVGRGPVSSWSSCAPR